MERSLCSLGKDVRFWHARTYTCSVLCDDGVERNRESKRSTKNNKTVSVTWVS